MQSIITTTPGKPQGWQETTASFKAKMFAAMPQKVYYSAHEVGWLEGKPQEMQEDCLIYEPWGRWMQE